MTEWIGLGLISAMALAIAILGGLALVRLNGYRRAERPEVLSADAFDSARYVPLARLMGPEDVEFLRRQAPCGSRLASQWDRTRRRVLRSFLNELAADFSSLHAQARALVTEAPEQHSQLAQILVRQQFVFWRIMAGVEMRLLFGRLGIGAVDGGALVETIEAMRAEIARSGASAAA